MYCSVLQCVAVCCSVLQCVAVCCKVLQGVARCGGGALCCSVLQWAAVSCSVLQCERIRSNPVWRPRGDAEEKEEENGGGAEGGRGRDFSEEISKMFHILSQYRLYFPCYILGGYTGYSLLLLQRKRRRDCGRRCVAVCCSVLQYDESVIHLGVDSEYWACWCGRRRVERLVWANFKNAPQSVAKQILFPLCIYTCVCIYVYTHVYMYYATFCRDTDSISSMCIYTYMYAYIYIYICIYIMPHSVAIQNLFPLCINTYRYAYIYSYMYYATFCCDTDSAILRSRRLLSHDYSPTRPSVSRTNSLA